MPPVAEANDRAAVGPQADRGRKVRRRPGLVAALGETKPMDALAADVHPDQRVAPFVIDRALADDVRGVEDQPWRHPLYPQPSAAERRNVLYPQPILRDEEIDNPFGY
jgi:hypothetical protein